MVEIIEMLKKYSEGRQNTDKVEMSVLNLRRIIHALERESTKQVAHQDELQQAIEIVRHYECNKEHYEACETLIKAALASKNS